MTTTTTSFPPSSPPSPPTSRSDSEDFGIALENVELTWEVYQKNSQYTVPDADVKGEEPEKKKVKVEEVEFTPKFKEYCFKELPRVIIGHGDLCNAMKLPMRSYKSYLSALLILEDGIENTKGVEKVRNCRASDKLAI